MEICNYVWRNWDEQNYIYDTGNCFKTKEEAEHRAELLETERQLMKYAREHNEKIDWENFEQDKYYLYYDMEDNEVGIGSDYCFRIPRKVYFSSEKIAQQAIKEIGEDKIEAYCKEL